MTGAELIEKIRQVLRDNEDVWFLGEFWDDNELLLCLNAAQDNFVNYCISASQDYYLNGLTSATLHESVTGIAVTTLPANYLHYISAQVGINPSALKTAKVYLGGDGLPYYYSNYNSAAIILSDSLRFVENGILSMGILYYYKRPSTIVAGAFADDFDRYIYYDIIANNAAIIAGIKEIQTGREYKKTARLMQELMSNPVRTANYVINKEISNITTKGLIDERRQQSRASAEGGE